MKIKTFIFLFFICVSGFLFASSDDSTVVFYASFLKNETQYYSIACTSCALEKNDTINFNRVSFSVDVNIVDSTSDVYIISWTLHDYKVDTPENDIQNLIKNADTVKLKFVVNKAGMLMEFLNWKQSDTFLDDAMKPFIQKYGKKGHGNSGRSIKVLFDFEKYMKLLILQSVRQYYEPYGTGYTLNKIVDVPDSSVFSFFSDKLLSGTVKKKLIEIDNTYQQASLSTYTSISGNDSIYSNLHILGAYVINIPTGWEIYSVRREEMKIGNVKNCREIEIKYIK